MRVSVSLNELLAAYEWVSSGEAAALDCEAYVDRHTGSIHWLGEGIDEEPPEDIEDASLYIRAIAPLRHKPEHLRPELIGSGGEQALVLYSGLDRRIEP